MNRNNRRVAVVTGGSKGLGLEVCRQLGKLGWAIVLTSRDEGRGRAAAEMLRNEGLDVYWHRLDVTDADSARRLADAVQDDFGRVDALVNNAGVLLDSGVEDLETNGILGANLGTIRETLETNTFGAIRVAQALAPLMRSTGHGCMVNVSSGMGQLSEMNGGWPGYRLSKVALNAVTRILSEELKGSGIKVNSVCPGWVRTDMGGANAPRRPEEGARGIVWAATLPPDGPSGGFFRDGRRIDW